MNNLYNLLQKIKTNPAFYLGKPSITCLNLFLNGYLDARMALGLDREGSGIEGFQDWIQERENTTLTLSWAGILLRSHQNESDAFYSFFEVFEEFFNQEKSTKSDKHEATQSTNSNVNEFKRSVDDIYEYLCSGAIKKRPGMYLGSASITRLDMVFRGNTLARREVGLAPTALEKEFLGFQFWVKERYGIKSNQSWAEIILCHSQDEKEALYRFFDLFEEYLNRDKVSEANENSR